MEVSREKLTDELRAFTDEELLRHLQSKSLTPLATEIATAELRSRGLELTGAEATGIEDAAPQGAQADLVTVSETWGLLQASVLRGRLEADGITAYVWSEPVGTPDASGGRARVQVERFQLEQAKAVMAAIERGDLEIPDSPDAGISAGDPARFARSGARGGAVTACDFMEELARRQHAFWFGFLFWFIGVAVVLSVVSAYAGKAASWLMPAVGYGSFLVTVFALLSRVRGLQCPHCHRRAGANPMQRYKFLFCNACGERIECRQPSSVDSS